MQERKKTLRAIIHSALIAGSRFLILMHTRITAVAFFSLTMLQSQSIKIECALLIGICFIRMLPARQWMHLSLPNPVTELRHRQPSFIPYDQLQTNPPISRMDTT